MLDYRYRVGLGLLDVVRWRRAVGMADFGQIVGDYGNIWSGLEEAAGGVVLMLERGVAHFPIIGIWHLGLRRNVHL